jgi:hypothetical protein
MQDPLLRIYYRDENNDTVRAHDELFPKAIWSAAKITGNRALYAKPVGTITTSIMDGSCVVVIDGAIPGGSFPRGMKVIYRTASGWDHGYMKVEGFADVPLSADCQARVYEAEKR